MNTLYCSECLLRLSTDDVANGICAACAKDARRAILRSQSRGIGSAVCAWCLHAWARCRGTCPISSIKALSIVMAVCVLSACAMIPTEFTPYTTAFAAQAASRGIDLSNVSHVRVVFADLDLPRIGDCSPGTHASRASVRVDRRYWATLSSAQREALVFHELGHCVLGAVHVEGALAIMQPNLIDAKEYSANRTRFIDELFGYTRSRDRLREAGQGLAYAALVGQTQASDGTVVPQKTFKHRQAGQHNTNISQLNR